MNIAKTVKSAAALTAAFAIPVGLATMAAPANAVNTGNTGSTVILAQDDNSPPPPGDEPPVRKSAEGTAPTEGLQELGACVSRNGQLDVMLLMDETGSLVPRDEAGEKWDGTDPEHNRIVAAQTFVDSLVDRQEDTKANMRIRVTGFGEQYKSATAFPGDYGDWTTLDAGSADKVKKEVEAFRDRTGEQWTEHGKALRGGYEDFTQFSEDQSNPCRMLVMFTDGASTSPDGGDAVRDQMCRAGGEVDRLRAAGISLVTIGLRNPDDPISDYDTLRAAAEGEPGECGDLPSNGAFFDATNVGGLVIAFQDALRSGGDYQNDGTAGEPFTFVLDDSLDSVRFAVTAEQDLGDKARIVLTAPDGSKLDLVDSGEDTVAGAKVDWVSHNEKFQGARGRMQLESGKSWAGEWKLAFADFDPEMADGRVVSTVQIQPDLQLRFTADGSEAEQGNVSFTDDQKLKVELVDGSGNLRQLKGKATTDLVFHQQGKEPVKVAEGADISSGSIEVPASDFPDAPVNGRLDAQTVITTAGDNDAASTEFSPIVSQTNVNLARQNMPQLGGAFSFATDTETGQATMNVRGPGKVWIAPDTTLNAEALPEDVREVKVSSEHDSQDSALEIPAGQTREFPVDFSIAEPTQGLVNGTVDVMVADLEGTEEPVAVPVNASGTYTVPLNTAAFTGALIATLLASLLIPLLIFYLIRYLTARIPTKATLRSQVFHLDASTGFPTFTGGSPQLGQSNVNEAPATLNPTSFSVPAGYSGKVKSFSLNPFGAVPVVLEQEPSISGEGEQIDHAAKLPLSLNNSWFVAASPQGPAGYDAVVLFNAATPQDELDLLARSIEREAPGLAQQLAEQRPAAGPQAGRPGDPYASATGQFGTAGPQGPNPYTNDPYATAPTDQFAPPPPVEPEKKRGFGGFGRGGNTPPPPPPPPGF